MAKNNFVAEVSFKLLAKLSVYQLTTSFFNLSFEDFRE